MDQQVDQDVGAEGARPRPGGPVFVVGSMGSGTTLLRLVLDSHDNLAIARETGFMRAVQADRCVPFWRFGGYWHRRLGWSDAEFDAALRDFYGGLFARLARDQGKGRWGDKTPFHVWHITEMLQLWPDAVVIGTVRHPGAVASSVRNRFYWGWPKSVRHWVRSNAQLLHEAVAHGERVVVCRYEDLVGDPEPVLREILDCVGEPWSPAVLEHHRVHTQRGTATTVEGLTRSDRPLDVARVGSWAESIDDEGRRCLRAEAAPLAEFFGYDLDRPGHLGALTEAGARRRFVLTGEDMLRRRDAFADRLDWSRRPRPSLADRPLSPQLLAKVAARHGEEAAEGRFVRAADGAERLARRGVRRLPFGVRARLRRALARPTAGAGRRT